MAAKSPDAIARKRANDRIAHVQRQQKYRLAHPEYVDSEQRRNARRHAASWKLHPDRAMMVAFDGETINSEYRILQFYGDREYRYDRPSGNITITQFYYMARDVAREIETRTNKTAHFYGYSFGYDFDRMIGADASITLEQKYHLARQKSRTAGANRTDDYVPYVSIGNPAGWHFHIQWHGKCFIMAHCPPNSENEVQTLRFYDFFSLYAKRFDKACKKELAYMSDAQRAEYAPMLAKITEGKEARGAWEGMSEQDIITYNLYELKWAAYLLNKNVAMCLDLGLHPKTLAGPAPIARAALMKYGVKAHIKPENYDTVEYQESETMFALRCATTAGRVENAVQGIYPPGMWNYDINSAHPTGLATAPCFAHCHYTRAQQKDIDDIHALRAHRGTLVHVRFHHQTERRFYGLFVRDNEGSILYPRAGEGWYFIRELYAAIEHIPGLQVEVLDAWIYHHDTAECNEEKPLYAAITELYNQRILLKNAGDAGENIVKLAINSIFGVAAQQSGAYKLTHSDGSVEYHTPPFSNLYLSSYTTANTRALLLSLIGPYDQQIFSVMTDGIYCAGKLPIDVPATKVLGEWNASDEMVASEHLLISPGNLYSADGDHKSRGVPAKVEYSALRQAYTLQDGVYRVKAQRYQTLQMSIRKEGDTYTLAPEWGQFIPFDYELDLFPTALRSKRDMLGGMRELGPHLTEYAARSYPGYCSRPYRRVWDTGALQDVRESIDESDL